MKNARASKPGHVTKGDVLDDLGLSREELVELKVKMDLWRDLVTRIAPLELSQKQLGQRWECINRRLAIYWQAGYRSSVWGR